MARSKASVPLVSSSLADPSVSFALKRVLSDWPKRNLADAAEDARLLSRVLGGEVDRRFGGRP